MLLRKKDFTQRYKNKRDIKYDLASYLKVLNFVNLYDLASYLKVLNFVNLIFDSKPLKSIKYQAVN